MKKKTLFIFSIVSALTAQAVFAQDLSMGQDDGMVPIPQAKPPGYTSPLFLNPDIVHSYNVGVIDGKTVRSESLLAAKGHFNIVEESRAVDPAQAHLAARKKVDIKRRAKMAELSPHFQPNAPSGVDGNIRVLYIEPAAGSEGEDVRDASQPSRSQFFEKIASIFTPDADEVRDFPKEADRDIAPSSIKPSKAKPSKVDVIASPIVNGVPYPPKLPDQKVVVQKVIIPAVKKTDQAVMLAQGGDGKSVALPKADVAAQRAAVFEEGEVARHTVKATKIRSGYHAGRVRIVIETSEPTQYKTAIDLLRNVLRVKIENARWSAQDWNGRLTDPKNVLGSFVAKNQQDGSVLVEMRLKKETRILNTMLLEPNNWTQHRVVIDLAS